MSTATASAELRVTLAVRAREAREASGLAVSEAADRAGITRGQLSDVENGKSGLGPLALYRLARVLGVRVETLLDVEPLGSASALDRDGWEAREREAFDRAVEFWMISAEDAAALSRVSFRARRPTTADGWWFVYQAIRRAV